MKSAWMRTLTIAVVALVIDQVQAVVVETKQRRKGRLECPPGPDPCTCNCAANVQPHALSSLMTQALPGGPPPPPTIPQLPAQPPPYTTNVLNFKMLIIFVLLSSSVTATALVNASMTPALMRDMSTLYLVHQKDGQVMIFTGLGDHTWQMTRLPSQQLAKVRMIMSFGRHGWQIKEGGVKIQASMPLAEQDPECPPLGAWHGIASGIAWAGDWVLQVEAPQLPPLELPPSICKKSFSLDAVALEDHVVRVDLTIHREPLTDEDVELCFGAMQRGVQEFAKRPEKTLLLSFSLQDASIPAMRHVKRLVALSHDMGHLLLLVARGSAIILRPHGFLGTAMVAIVRFVQNHAAAPWPETIVPSMVEAAAETV
eukprot:symbB.v1.2.007371.t1/scaffold449.1/size202926/1